MGRHVHLAAPPHAPVPRGRPYRLAERDCIVGTGSTVRSWWPEACGPFGPVRGMRWDGGWHGTMGVDGIEVVWDER